MNWFSKPKKYVFISSGYTHGADWTRVQLYSENPMIARHHPRYNEFLFLLPDGTVEGDEKRKWRRDPPDA